MVREYKYLLRLARTGKHQSREMQSTYTVKFIAIFFSIFLAKVIMASSLNLTLTIFRKGEIFHPWQSIGSLSSPDRNVRSFRKELLQGRLALNHPGNVDTVCIDPNGYFFIKNSSLLYKYFLDKEQIESLLKDLHEKDSVQLKSSENQPPKPKLTDVKTLNIDKEIAKNLAMYGNPLGIFRESPGNKQKIKSGKNYQKTWIEK